MRHWTAPTRIVSCLCTALGTAPSCQDERARALQAKTAGGPAVQAAASQALDGGEDAIIQFLATGLPQAQQQDERARALAIMMKGGPATREMAKIALDGGPDMIHEFLAAGAEVAAARDETLTSVSELAAQATAAGKEAAAETEAAKEASAQAVAAADRAKAAAQKAAAETAAAKDSADQAAAAAGKSGRRRSGGGQGRTSGDQCCWRCPRCCSCCVYCGGAGSQRGSARGRRRSPSLQRSVRGGPGQGQGCCSAKCGRLGADRCPGRQESGCRGRGGEEGRYGFGPGRGRSRIGRRPR
ncbi:hypothetical protein DRA43_16390 [Micromonospora provocatoris]|nr:hypothetical protein DRA43_16390 [Micromonospora provocatoris]